MTSEEDNWRPLSNHVLNTLSQDELIKMARDGIIDPAPIERGTYHVAGTTAHPEIRMPRDYITQNLD